MRLVCSYYTDISRSTVNKTLNPYFALLAPVLQGSKHRTPFHTIPPPNPNARCRQIPQTQRFRCVLNQKSSDLIYFAVEGWYHAFFPWSAVTLILQLLLSWVTDLWRALSSAVCGRVDWCVANRLSEKLIVRFFTVIHGSYSSWSALKAKACWYLRVLRQSPRRCVPQDGRLHQYRWDLPISTNFMLLIRFLRLLALTMLSIYEGWNFNSGNYLFTTDTE